MIKCIVDNEVEQSAQVRNIAAERVVWIDGNMKTVQVESIVRHEELLQVGVFVPLHFFGGKTVSLEITESLISKGIHGFGRMTEKNLPGLTVEVYILLFAGGGHEKGGIYIR